MADTTTGTPTGAPSVREVEQKKKRATTIRVLIYVAATHLWAGLLLLMFAVGRH
ncbi:DUF6126 family protein [Streptomyces sp. NPDC092296]|uniref:DUF6126 family protein n=1 Tax=Streptomyces sp. NPDC092296 TaxID=3366012 RepID=UPI003812BDA8